MTDYLPYWAHLEAARICLERATKTIAVATVASCECGTKTPDPAFHNETCRYRRLEEALSNLASCRFAIARAEPKLVQSSQATTDSSRG